MFMRRFSAILLLLCFSLPAIAQESENSPELIRIDRNHSTMGFNVPIVKGLSKVTGKFTDFSIDLICDEANLNASFVQLVIQVKSRLDLARLGLLRLELPLFEHPWSALNRENIGAKLIVNIHVG